MWSPACVSHWDDSTHLQELKFHPPLLHVKVFNSKMSQMFLAELLAGQIKMKYNNIGLPIFEFLWNMFLPHPPNASQLLAKITKTVRWLTTTAFQHLLQWKEHSSNSHHLWILISNRKQYFPNSSSPPLLGQLSKIQKTQKEKFVVLNSPSSMETTFSCPGSGLTVPRPLRS